MRSLSLTTLALSAALAVAAGPALASHTARTDMAPAATVKTEPQVAFGFGFYTCVGTMYRYGQRTYGRRVDDALLFQAAYDVCAAAY